MTAGELLILIAASIPGVGAPAPVVPGAAVSVAERHVASGLRDPGFGTASTLRSRRNPSWALVSGFARTGPAGAPGPVAVWLHLEGGAWRVRAAADRRTGLNPPGPPCDLRPAFGRPAC